MAAVRQSANDPFEVAGLPQVVNEEEDFHLRAHDRRTKDGEKKTQQVDCLSSNLILSAT
jgi:hypothetical protein